MNGTAEQPHGQLELPAAASGEEFARVFFQKFAELYFNIEADMIRTGKITLRSGSKSKRVSRKDRERETVILAWIIEEFWRRHNHILTDYMAILRLSEAAAEARLNLKYGDTAYMNQPFITCLDDGNPIHLELTLTRKTLEELENERQSDRVLQ